MGDAPTDPRRHDPNGPRMLLSSIALAVVAAFVLSILGALLVSTRRAASLDQSLLLDLVLDGGTRGPAARRDRM